MIAGSFEPWFGKTVVLRLITGETRVPLRGIIVGESGRAVRFRIEGGWDIDVNKSLILAVECEKGQLNSQSDQVNLGPISAPPRPRVGAPQMNPRRSSYLATESSPLQHSDKRTYQVVGSMTRPGNMETSTSPDLTYEAIRPNTMRDTIQCPNCGKPIAHPKLLQVGDLVLNPATYDASRAGKVIALSRTEFRLLESLMRRTGRVVSRNALVHSVWDSDGDVNGNLIDVSICQLRKKVDRDHEVKLIKTVRNLGYAIRDPAMTS
jgi:hypothetical protein